MTCCMYDKDNQCVKDCPNCVRYARHYECDYCGCTDEPLFETDDGIRCQSCLTALKVNKECVEDIKTEFISRFDDEFRAFVVEWFEDVRVKC